MDFAQIILSPFVWLLKFFYNFTNSYGMALILFAIVVKIILFPFSLKGKRSMIQMNMLSAKMQKLQKQYGKDRERYNMELQKLYEKENVNPMSGCMWSFIPLLILFPLYAIIRQPLKYMMGVNSQELYDAVANVVNWSATALDAGWIKTAADSFANTGYNQLHLAALITPENLSAVQTALGETGSKVFAINFDFLGFVDLSQTPVLKFWTIAGGFGLFLLPVISAVSGFVFSLLSMKTNAVNQQSAQANSTAKSMLIMSPLMSLWIGFAMPAALCVYWIANNLLSMLQEWLCGRLLKKDYEKAAQAKAEQEQRDKEEEKERRRLAAEERARRLEEEKKNRGKRKTEKKPDEDDDKIPGAVKEASRVGVRQYARGRAYDPNRFSPDGPTAYTDPDEVIAQARARHEAEMAEAQAEQRRKQEEKAAKKRQKKGLPPEEPVEKPAETLAEEVPAVEDAAPVEEQTAAVEEAVEDVPATPGDEGAEAPYAADAEAEEEE